ncbi:beta-ketoacyl synthase N-terminal-like domain-containing protein [Tahibacter harae]|uniref:Ketosynthase family 3 (KS3) domain-containing protein n=1 Tax=Tahibacter harae TaxID=2963937 RepID=A0ABT1QLS7_9GAMM|nr:beta-ketoacyl synthase N-terminal-like domain-containing protein [Tahibacter harae]MCQ4163479.1 hypothetical protein [Tahibacter harae]
MPELVISALGVTSAIGQGKAAFAEALFAGRHAFGRLQRPGRSEPGDDSACFLGAEIADLSLPPRLPARSARTASLAAQVAAATLQEAWDEARLDQVDAGRIGLVVGGSNMQQRELVRLQAEFAGRAQYLRPSYATSFLDTDICGLCTELFGIRGFACTLGAASASGQIALIQAAQAVAAGQADACIALGALMDLSYWECQALRSAGAMGSDVFAGEPAQACRPFDRRRDGFIYGENCAALVVETAASARARGLEPYAHIAGCAWVMDANRSTNPSHEGELRALRQALGQAGVDAAMIDYVNPHGTGSPLGDETELRAICDAGLAAASINATKSITGHGLTAAGAVELAAVALQLRAGRLHPTRNLDDPVAPGLNWVGAQARQQSVRWAVSLSMGFGGFNSAVCLRHPQA